MIGVIDYGIGHSGSIMNMFSRIGAPAMLTRDAEKVGERCLESLAADAFYRRATELHEEVVEKGRIRTRVEKASTTDRHSTTRGGWA